MHMQTFLKKLAGHKMFPASLKNPLVYVHRRVQVSTSHLLPVGYRTRVGLKLVVMSQIMLAGTRAEKLSPSSD